jgi:mono/diheme cytochrome c family protein
VERRLIRGLSTQALLSSWAMRRHRLPFLLLALAACSDRDIDAILALDGDPVAGEEVFASVCAECHGADARGGRGPDLTVEAPKLSDEELADTIVNGSMGGMPAQGVSDQEAADVMAWLRQEFGT